MNFTKLYDWNENTVEFHVVHVNKCVELVCLCGCGGKGKNFKNPPIVSTFNITSFKKVSTIRLSTHPVLKKYIIFITIQTSVVALLLSMEKTLKCSFPKILCDDVQIL